MRLMPKLLLSVVGGATLCGVLVIAGQAGLERTARVGRSLDQAQAVLLQASDLRAAGRTLQRDVQNTLLTPAADRAAFVDRAAARADEMRAMVTALRQNRPDAAFLTPQAAALNEMMMVVDAVRMGDASAALVRLRTAATPLSIRSGVEADAFITAQGAEVERLTAAAAQSRAFASRLRAWAAVLGLAAALMAGTSVLLLLVMRRPLAHMARAMDGDLQAVKDAAARQDELGEWARAVMALRTQALERHRPRTAKVPTAALAA